MSTRNPHPPILNLSHLELYANDIARMEAFYTGPMGFAVTDRGPGDAGLVFLSRNPGEHHQLVLHPRASAEGQECSLNHIAFRVTSLTGLRRCLSSLLASEIPLQTVSHGTTWSIYCQDPEGHRLELFTDTPWHVNQPCRFEIDLELPDEDLFKFTEQKIKGLPGFRALRR